MHWPKSREETCYLLRGYAFRLVHDLEAGAGACVEALLGRILLFCFFLHVSQTQQAPVQWAVCLNAQSPHCMCCAGVGTSCQETPGDSSLQQRSSWLASEELPQSRCVCTYYKKLLQSLFFIQCLCISSSLCVKIAQAP